jgi:hypothetical protein
MPPAGFKLTITASEWLQTHDLDRVATGINHHFKTLYVFPPGWSASTDTYHFLAKQSILLMHSK